MFRFIASILLCASFTVHASQDEISVNSTLDSFVRWAAGHLEKNVIVGADLTSSPLSVYAKYQNQKQLESLLESVVLSSGFYYSVSGNSIRIGSAESLDIAELKTDVVLLNHVQSDFAAKSVQEVLDSRSENEKNGFKGKVTASPTLNSLIITAPLEEMEVIREVISAIDAPREQIVISAVVAELSDMDYEALGVRLSSGGGKSGAEFDFIGSATRPATGFSAALYSSGDLLAMVDLVKNSDNSRLLSTPSILTINRQPASLLVGQEIPVITGKETNEGSSTENPFQTFERIEVGLGLDVTPIITPSGAIELKVLQTASSISNDTTASDVITNTRRINTTVSLQRGQSVLLGGLRTANTFNSNTGVPIISGIPLVGKLFQSNSEKTEFNNLVVLITADIYGGSSDLPKISADDIFVDLGFAG